MFGLLHVTFGWRCFMRCISRFFFVTFPSFAFLSEPLSISAIAYKTLLAFTNVQG